MYAIKPMLKSIWKIPFYFEIIGKISIELINPKNIFRFKPYRSTLNEISFNYDVRLIQNLEQQKTHERPKSILDSNVAFEISKDSSIIYQENTIYDNKSPTA